MVDQPENDPANTVEINLSVLDETHPSRADLELAKEEKDFIQETKQEDEHQTVIRESSNPTEAEALLQQAQLELDDARKEKIELKKKLFVSEGTVVELKDTVNQLGHSLADAVQARSAALEETSTLQADSEMAKEKKDRILQQLIELQATYEVASADMVDMENELTAEREGRIAVQSTVDDLQHELVDAVNVKEAVLKSNMEVRHGLESA
ncbi:unnamed protein product [Cylindrotheca closterium]|uniref:Uncharacterized protein n=1 Tax=Cylindrotheca closterium TaxID=2856 RepID=A0AAD2D0F5_9STRA|nr:unnamed protein product [Cylindrotheca closterium]